MTSQELTAWRSRMGWTAKAASQALGLSQHGYAAYERGWIRAGTADGKPLSIGRPIPKHVALACAAIEAGISAASASANP